MRITKYTTELNDNRVPILVKEKAINYSSCFKYFNNPDNIAQMLCDVYRANKQTEEVCYLLCMDVKCNLQGVFELSRGTVNVSLLSSREVFMKALLCGAVQIIIAHNHPSGDVTPSSQDIAVFNSIRDAGKILGVNLVDFLIIGNNCDNEPINMLSFKERKLM